MTNDRDIVTLNELAFMLRLSKRWLRKETTAGRLPCLKAGYRTLYNVEAVRSELARRAAAGEVSDAK